MVIRENKIARYKIIADSGGNRYSFYCAASDMLMCTTRRIRAETREKELANAWETEGRRHFSQCTKCGRWVSNAMYNIDASRCVDCAPWEDEPKYCSQCGSELHRADVFCSRCGSRIQHGEVAV